MVDEQFTILVVDDDEANRESLKRRLERRGYILSVASDGNEALRLIAAQSFDLIILDVMMPGISGLEVLDRVRQTHSTTQLPIIMATAQDASEDVVFALDHGANDYVTKPLDFAVVQARVRTQLQLKRSVDQVVQLEHNLSRRNAELESANNRLRKAAARTAFELESAARVQKAFLPSRDVRFPGAIFEWIFEPCTELAGDALNVIRLDDHHVAFFVLDVSGHGVAASLLAVAATRVLSLTGTDDSLLMAREPDGSLVPAPPAQIATKLDAQFGFDSEASQFLTLFYGVLDLRSLALTYVSAGHPSAICVSPDGTVAYLPATASVIGLGGTYEQQTVALQVGQRLHVYSDGVTECRAADSQLFGMERLVTEIKCGLNAPLRSSLDAISRALSSWRGTASSKDDVSIIALECIS